MTSRQNKMSLEFSWLNKIQKEIWDCLLIQFQKRNIFFNTNWPFWSGWWPLGNKKSHLKVGGQVVKIPRKFIELFYCISYEVWCSVMQHEKNKRPRNYPTCVLLWFHFVKKTTVEFPGKGRNQQNKKNHTFILSSIWFESLCSVCYGEKKL